MQPPGTTPESAPPGAGSTATGPHPPGPGRFVARARIAVRELRALAADRVRAEQEAEAVFARDTAAVEREHRQRTQDVAQRRKSLVQELESAQAKAVERATREAAADRERTAQAEALARSKILGKGDQNETEARKQWEDAVWATETVFEAKEDQPDELFHQAESLVEAARRDLATIEQRARDHLKRCRLRVPPSAGAEEAAAGADDGAARATPAASLAAQQENAREHLAELEHLKLPRLFRGPIVAVVVIGIAGAAGAVAAWRHGWRFDGTIAITVASAIVAALLVLALLYAIALRRSRQAFRAIERAVADASRSADRALLLAEQDRDRCAERLRQERDRDIAIARSRYEPILAEILERKATHLSRIASKYPALRAEIDAREREAIEAAERRANEERVAAEGAYARERDEIDAAHREARRALDLSRTSVRNVLERAWMDGMRSCAAAIGAIESESAELFPPWSDPAWSQWRPPRSHTPSVRLGSVRADRRAITGSIPADERLRVPCPEVVDLPVTLDFPDRCGLLVRSDPAQRVEAQRAIESAMVRLLTGLPPGKVRFTIFDPIGLGRGFAGFMHLADHEESFVTSRIWTEARHIEQRLADLTEHMENVIQKYLRNEYETIEAYNRQAGEIAEPYRFLVYADFPSNLSETAARRLASVLRSGARCGVFALIAWDERQALPPGIDADDLREIPLRIVRANDGFVIEDDVLETLPLAIDEPPAEAILNEILRRVGEAAKDATRVEVPFRVVTPTAEREWTGDCTTALRVPLGRCGATKLQELVVGPGTSQHVLVAGKTGSGKSTLLHVLVTNLALWYSPDEVQFYLVDFKKGVEFKTYARPGLPHVRAVAVESDREFGLSVLQKIDAEMKRRGERYRALGVQDLAGFRAAVAGAGAGANGERLPRTLLVIDEFQELFTEDDRIGQEAALLLDRLVRQGRAFGIHVLLGSQTLGGAYSLPRSTMGQMQVRIALQCAEADSYIVMSDDNAAARLLSRPGEAIYNDKGGAIEGNSPFQVVWLSDRERDEALARVESLARERGVTGLGPIVFEGNAPADLARNRALAALLDGSAPPAAGDLEAWLGEPITIKSPTTALFRRQSGSNLLIVGQREESARALAAAAMVSLAAHAHAAAARGEAARVWIFDGTPAETPGAGYLARVAERLPIEATVVGPAPAEIDAALGAIAKEIERRSALHGAGGDAPWIVFIHGLQRFRSIRIRDDFSFSSSDPDAPPSPDRLFADLIREGPPLGIHVIAWADTAANLNRTLDRQRLGEFDMRVLFQMGGADSTQLIDTPAASNLGLHRAIFYSEERAECEKFRPYALPEDPWLEEIARKMR